MYQLTENQESLQQRARELSDTHVKDRAADEVIPLSFIEVAMQLFASAIKVSVDAAQLANSIAAKSARIFLMSSSGIVV